MTPAPIYTKSAPSDCVERNVDVSDVQASSHGQAMARQAAPEVLQLPVWCRRAGSRPGAGIQPTVGRPSVAPWRQGAALDGSIAPDTSREKGVSNG